jgi:hypothetical protein
MINQNCETRGLVIPLVLLVLAGVGVLAIERASARACGCRW